jgi:hypothetical protein
MPSKDLPAVATLQVQDLSAAITLQGPASKIEFRGAGAAVAASLPEFEAWDANTARERGHSGRAGGDPAARRVGLSEISSKSNNSGSPKKPTEDAKPDAEVVSAANKSAPLFGCDSSSSVVGALNVQFSAQEVLAQEPIRRLTTPRKKPAAADRTSPNVDAWEAIAILSILALVTLVLRPTKPTSYCECDQKISKSEVPSLASRLGPDFFQAFGRKALEMIAAVVGRLQSSVSW